MSGRRPRVRAGHLPAEGEAAFQQKVIQFARHNGWHVWAPPPNRPSAKTGRVPKIVGVVGGMPDLHLWRIPVIGELWHDLPVCAGGVGEFLLAELKTDKGRVRSDQTATIEQLRACGLEVVVWRPAEFETVIAPRLMRRWAP